MPKSSAEFDEGQLPRHDSTDYKCTVQRYLQQFWLVQNRKRYAGLHHEVQIRDVLERFADESGGTRLEGDHKWKVRPGVAGFLKHRVDVDPGIA